MPAEQQIQSAESANEAGQQDKKDDADVLRTQYLNLLDGCSWSQEDKNTAHAWLDSPEGHDAGALKTRIQYFAAAEKASQDLIVSYEKKTDRAIKEGRFSTKHRKENLEWFKKLSFLKRQKYLAKCDLDDPKRKEIYEMFKKLPQVERKLLQTKFDDAGLTKRIEDVTQAMQKHVKLKETFLKLPKAVQEKYKDKFKQMTFEEREAFLLALGATTDDDKEKKKEAANDGPEKELKTAFHEKTAKLVVQNLLTDKSKRLYDDWFDKLPLEEKRKRLHISDLDTRMNERVQVKDELTKRIEKMPEAQREIHMREFKNADLDERKKMLEDLKKPEKTKEKYRSYPSSLVKHELQKTLEDPELAELRLLFTEVDYSREIVRRSELVEHATREGIAEKKMEEGREIDSPRRLDIHELEHHREHRSWWRRFLLGKKGKGEFAKGDFVLRNRQFQSINAEEFDRVIVAGHKKALLDKLVAKTSARLPGIDPKTLFQYAEHMQLRVDLRNAPA